MPRYYLETNAIRKLAGKLSHPWIIANCFTSIHTICELLTDLSEENYPLKRNAITQIINSGIYIDWELPQKIQFESYGVFGIQYQFDKNIVESLMKEITNSENMAEYMDNIEKMSLMQVYRKIQKNDEGYYTYFDAEMKRKTAEFRTAIPAFNERKGLVEGITEPLMLYSNSFNPVFVEALKPAVQIKMGEDIYNSELNHGQLPELDEFIKGYSRRIDIFFIVSGYYTMKKNAVSDSIAINDFNDLYHLMYISNDDIIVSNDHLFSDTMKKLLPNNVMTSEELISNFSLTTS